MEIKELLKERSWILISLYSLEEFIFDMLKVGTPVETLLVGNFNDHTRGARRDIELPFHQDGVYSKKLAEKQGGQYVEHPNVDIVGFYCIRENENCFTLVKEDDIVTKLCLKRGQALIFDNRKVFHAREGQVGDRLLFRMWMQEK